MTDSRYPRGASSPSPRDVEEALLPHRRALAALMRLPSLTQGDVEATLARLTEVAATLLDVERASIWNFDRDKSVIVCMDLFERGAARHTRGIEIADTDARCYFESLVTERVIAAHDARTDPRTSEFTETYLIPNGITSMLDAPVFVGGEMAGVVCNEHVGPARTWECCVARPKAGLVADRLAVRGCSPELFPARPQGRAGGEW